MRKPRSADLAQRGHRQGVVRPLDAVGLRGERHVGAVIHEEAGAMAARRLAKGRGEGEELAHGEVLFPELDGAKPGFQAGLHDLREWPARLHPIGDEIEREAGAAAQLVLQSGTPSMGEDAVA